MCVYMHHMEMYILQVLPNQHHIAKLPLKYYKFAGCLVGKCLYDSAVSNSLLVKARFARSFLAQMIGLKINYKVNHSTCVMLLI